MLPLNISFVQIIFGVLFMIEISKEAADMLKSKVVEDKVIRMSWRQSIHLARTMA